MKIAAIIDYIANVRMVKKDFKSRGLKLLTITDSSGNKIAGLTTKDMKPLYLDNDEFTVFTGVGSTRRSAFWKLVENVAGKRLTTKPLTKEEVTQKFYILNWDWRKLQ